MDPPSRFTHASAERANHRLVITDSQMCDTETVLQKRMTTAYTVVITIDYYGRWTHTSDAPPSPAPCFS
jgi:hypothetical protein